MAARGMSAVMAENLVGSSLADVASRAPIGIEEKLFVERKRAECGRIGWQALADMTGRNVHDLRMLCDPEYRAAFAKPEAAKKERLKVVRRTLADASAPRGNPAGSNRVQALRRAGYEGDVVPDTHQARALAVLLERPATSGEIGRCLKIETKHASAVMQALYGKDLVNRIWPNRGRICTYTLTIKGAAEARRLAEEIARG